ncbi:hypothetical protein QLX67_07790, partial [Balneolaceae bacterium ANBcel3]|nr:hypothetical protein [Balneolaceae bacterium ANBcel3]
MSTHHNAYPVFEGDQVLTASQLNSLRGYLETQTLASRRDLIGTGIVSGLTLERITPNGFVLSEGIGITGRGYLIRLERSDCRYLTRYTDVSSPCGCGAANAKEDGPYAWFQKDGKELPVWELLTGSEANERRESDIYPIDINNQQEIVLSGDDSDTVISLDQHVIVLYMEREDEDLEDCFGDDCDEKGIQRSFKVRKLLVPGPEILKSVSRPDAKAHIVHLRRPFFSETQKEYGLTSLYSYGAMKKAYSVAIDQTVPDLERAVAEAWKQYRKLLGKGFPASGHMDEWMKQGSIKERLDKAFNRQPYTIQRYYDGLRFLCKAWNECVEALDQAGRLDKAKHPRHLIIGEPVLTDPVDPVRYRHVFQAASAQKKHRHQEKRAWVLFRRFVELVEALGTSVHKDGSILIQPSPGLNMSLARQPRPGWIPDSTNNHLAKVWDPDAWMYERPVDERSIFTTSFTKGSNSVPSIDVNAEKHAFYRIEGHLGLPFDEALEKLEAERQRLNMPVKIIGLKLGRKAQNLVFDTECRFDDLDQWYQVLMTELNCLFNEEITFFSNLRIEQKKEESADVKESEAKKEDIQIEKGEIVKGSGVYEAFEKELSASHGLSESDIKGKIELAGKQVVTETTHKAAEKDFYSNKRAASQAYDGASFMMLNQELKNPVSTAGVTTMDLISDQVKKYEELDIVRVIDAYPELVLNPVVVNILISRPVQLVNRIRIVLNSLPEKPAELDLDVVSEAFDALVKQALSYREEVLGSEDNFSGQKGMILYRLDKLVHLCGIEKLRTIHSWYKDRIEQYSQLRLLHTFAERHSGMEHLAGVPSGGTL